MARARGYRAIAAVRLGREDQGRSDLRRCFHGAPGLRDRLDKLIQDLRIYPATRRKLVRDVDREWLASIAGLTSNW